MTRTVLDDTLTKP